MSENGDTPEYIPLSYINAYAYCPRRFYYEFTLAEMVVNEHVLEGQQIHERVDMPGRDARGTTWQWRRVYLCAPVLGLSGYCDLVEAAEAPGDAAAGSGQEALAALAQEGRLWPVEYKKGRLGRWLSDHAQLCAQALALEEVLAAPAGCIGHGYVFYFGSARREEVAIDADLRARTLALLAEARAVAVLPQPPAPITEWRKCRDCSLEPICLPREVLGLLGGGRRDAGDGDTVSD